MRIAVIDVGTNTTRLYVAEVNDGSVPEAEPRDNIVQISSAPTEAAKP